MASKLQYRGGVTKEAEQRWSRGGKGPLLCILLCGSQGEAAAICALRCCHYVLCNGKTGCRSGHSGFFFPQSLSSVSCSGLNLPPTHSLHVLTAEIESLILKLRSRWSVLFLLTSFTRDVSRMVDDTSLVTGKTWLVAARGTLLLWTRSSFLTYWRKARSLPLANLPIHPSLFVFLYKGNVASHKRRN